MLQLDLVVGLQVWAAAHRAAWEARHSRVLAMRHLTAARQAGGFEAWASFAADGGALRRLLQRGVSHGIVRCLRCWRDAAAAAGDARASRCGAAARLLLRGLALAWAAWAAAAAAAAARGARGRLAASSARRGRTQRALRALREHALRRRALSRAFRGLLRAARGARAASGAARQLAEMAVRSLGTRRLRFGWAAWRGRLGEAARLLQLGRRVTATKAHLRLAAGLAAFLTHYALGHTSGRKLRDARTRLLQLRLVRACRRWAAAAAARGAVRAAVTRLLLGRAGRALEAWAAASGQRASAALHARAALRCMRHARAARGLEAWAGAAAAVRAGASRQRALLAEGATQHSRRMTTTAWAQWVQRWRSAWALRRGWWRWRAAWGRGAQAGRTSHELRQQAEAACARSLARRAWRCWVDAAAESTEVARGARLMRAALSLRGLSRGFLSWHAAWAGGAAARKLMLQCVQRLFRRELALGLAAWVEAYGRRAVLMRAVKASIAAAVQRLQFLGLGGGFAALRDNRVVQRVAWLAAKVTGASLSSRFDALRRGCTACHRLRRGATAAAARLARALRAWAAARRERTAVLRSSGLVRRVMRAAWQAGGFAAWAAFAADVGARRRRLRRGLLALVHERRRRAWRAWRRRTAQGAVARRSVLLLRGAQRWRGWVALRASREASRAWRGLHRIALSHARDRLLGGAWGEWVRRNALTRGASRHRRTPTLAPTLAPT